jgi:hypothetical protein
MAKLKIPMATLCAVGPDGQSQLLAALRRIGDTELPVRTFYWLNRIRATLEQEHGHFEVARLKLYQKLGELVPDAPQGTQCYKVPPEKMNEFGKGVAELIGFEIELPAEQELQLQLPSSGVGNDWYVVMTALPIFEEPSR